MTSLRTAALTALALVLGSGCPCTGPLCAADTGTDSGVDTAFGLLLCATRQLPQADRYLRAGKWLDRAFPVTASLRGRTMGIVGLGRIGKAIARRGEASVRLRANPEVSVEAGAEIAFSVDPGQSAVFLAR